MKTITGRLLKSGSRFARSALIAYPDDALVFALHAETAMEHLLKAYLFEINPLLVLNRKASEAAAIWYAREENHDRDALPKANTIGCGQAIGLALAAGLPIKERAQKLESLREMRNSAAHMGHVDAKALKVLAADFVFLCQAVASALSVEHAELFGESHDLAVALVEDYTNAIEKEYSELTAVARLFLANKYGEELESFRETLEHSAQAEWIRQDVSDQLIACPVCDLPAYMSGRIDIEWVYLGRDDEWSSPEPVCDYTGEYLYCPTCGWELDDEPLVHWSGITDDWEMPDRDAEQAIEDEIQGQAEAWAEDRYR